MAKSDLTAERLRELLHYDPETGVFTWLFQCKSTRPAGSIAGTKNNGYLQIGVEQKRYYAHRLAWLYMTGEWPKDVIDHINRVKHDNRWGNLRDTSQSANVRNSHVNEICKGARKNKGFTWSSRIHIKNKAVFLGNYLTEDAAIKAVAQVRARFPDEDSMLQLAEQLKTEAEKTIAATKIRLKIGGLSVSVKMASTLLGIPERTMYYRLNNGHYSDLQISRA